MTLDPRMEGGRLEVEVVHADACALVTGAGTRCTCQTFGQIVSEQDA